MEGLKVKVLSCKFRLKCKRFLKCNLISGYAAGWHRSYLSTMSCWMTEFSNVRHEAPFHQHCLHLHFYVNKINWNNTSTNTCNLNILMFNLNIFGEGLNPKVSPCIRGPIPRQTTSCYVSAQGFATTKLNNSVVR